MPTLALGRAGERAKRPGRARSVSISGWLFALEVVLAVAAVALIALGLRGGDHIAATSVPLDIASELDRKELVGELSTATGVDGEELDERLALRPVEERLDITYTSGERAEAGRVALAAAQLVLGGAGDGGRAEAESAVEEAAAAASAAEGERQDYLESIDLEEGDDPAEMQRDGERRLAELRDERDAALAAGDAQAATDLDGDIALEQERLFDLEPAVAEYRDLVGEERDAREALAEAEADVEAVPAPPGAAPVRTSRADADLGGVERVLAGLALVLVLVLTAAIALRERKAARYRRTRSANAIRLES